MHLKVSFLNFIISFSGQSDRFSEEILDLFDLTTDLTSLLEELETVDEELFENHDDKKISCQTGKALAVKGSNKVTDVGVHELEHVDLVDNRVFKVGVVAMVFIKDNLHCRLVIDLSKENN